MKLLFRQYRPEDLPAIKQITVEAFGGVSIDRNIQEHFGTIGGHDWKWRKARHIDEDLERPEAAIFVAEVEARVAGYITTWIDRAAGVGWIPNLAVEATLRGQGIGRQLIQQALDHFRRQGVAAARIETLEQNPVGQQLYPSLGFREVARQIHYCLRLDEPEAGGTGEAN